jgi:hypothetical protein
MPCLQRQRRFVQLLFRHGLKVDKKQPQFGYLLGDNRRRPLVDGEQRHLSMQQSQLAAVHQHLRCKLLRERTSRTRTLHRPHQQRRYRSRWWRAASRRRAAARATSDCSPRQPSTFSTTPGTNARSQQHAIAQRAPAAAESQCARLRVPR